MTEQIMIRSNACRQSPVRPQTTPFPGTVRGIRRTAVRHLLSAMLFCLPAAAFSHDAPAPTKMLKVIPREEGGLVHFYVQNLEAAEVTATFDVKLENLKANTNFPYTTVFPGGQTVEAFTLSPIQHDRSWSYSYTDAFTIGNPNAVHDDSQVYLLPYAAGSTFKVTQGYHGAFSHTGPDEYSIDWKMPIGTPVHAARGGTVVKVKVDSNDGGPDRKFESCANCILIEHSDGTIGIYAHLMHNGSKVKVGDTVAAGDLIGWSGNTGFTSGPHLHFSVFKTRSGRERVSLPVRFKTVDNPGMTLVSGQSYKAGAVEIQQVKADAPLPLAADGKKRAGG